MSDIYCESHIRKMEPVAQPDQAERYAMMRYQLFEVLSRLFQHQQKYNHLLCPVARLQQIVCLKYSFMRLVGETLVHGRCIEVPNWRP